jgi:hypothetical protein
MLQETTTSIDADADAHPESTKTYQGRRLTDKLLLLFHEACDQGKYDVARQLLAIVEDILRNPQRSPEEPNRRKSIRSLVAAHERLWNLIH